MRKQFSLTRTLLIAIGRAKSKSASMSAIQLPCVLVFILAGARLAPGQTPLLIGGFDVGRSGHISFPSGDYFSQARASVNASLGPVEFHSFPTLTFSNLEPLDVLVLAPGTTHSSAAPPLSPSEQTALRDYVLSGGGAVILADNYSYATGAEVEETALLNPFGLAGCCTLFGTVLAIVPTPEAHALTSGRFGTASNFSQLYPGGITDLGPYAHSLATNALGTALAAIETGAMGTGAGRVAVFSDGNTFADDGDIGTYTQNRGLFLNTVDWVRRVSRRPKLLIDRGDAQVRLHWSTNTVGFRLEAAAAAGPAVTWERVTNAVTLIDSEIVLTLSSLAAEQYFRLVTP